MKKAHVCQCLLLITVLAISPGGSISCSKVTSREVVSNIFSAYSKISTYSVKESMTAITEVVGGEQPGTILTSCNGTGIINIENRQFEIHITQHGQPFQGMQTFSREYLVNEWLYIKSDISGLEDRDHEIWVKLNLGDEQLNHNDRLWKDNNPVGQQIELLSTAKEVTLEGNENINGVETYVLNFEPDRQALADWLSLQPPWRGPRFIDLPEPAGSLSFRLWLCKETYSILKSEIEVDYEMVSFDSSKSTVKLKGEIIFNDYNKPFEIKLPQEAIEAVEGPIS